jgi:hypothetical protein
MVIFFGLSPKVVWKPVLNFEPSIISLISGQFKKIVLEATGAIVVVVVVEVDVLVVEVEVVVDVLVVEELVVVEVACSTASSIND